MGVAVTSAGVPGSAAPGGTADGAGGPEPAVSGVGGPYGGELSAARPQLIRALNGRLLLGHIRDLGQCSRAELARISGLSKPTVSVALADAERAGLVRTAGQRTGRPGRSALLYELRPEAGFILGLDVGAQFVRGALADLAGGIRARASVRSRASSVRGRVGELVELADGLCAQAGLTRSGVTQTVIGSPGVYDPRRNAMALTGGLPGWDRPAALARLREAFGPSLAVENDVDAAALAERAQGCGREADSFAFVSVGTGIGMGLVLGGQLVRGAHGVAGEIAYMPMSGGAGTDPEDARRRGVLEASASASAVVRAARRAGMRGQVSARRVFAAAARGDERATAVVAEEAQLVARLLCAVVTVIDPGLIVLGGGIGQAPGFATAVTRELRDLAPVMPEVSVSALGTEAVVDGCLAAGTDLAWAQLTAAVPAGLRDGQHAGGTDAPGASGALVTTSGALP
ncbi:MAG TPA: ROK family transcriptional regulator [Streptosporangiaceae bacterium]|nr:ROK family transcriptional regulator [Streptosporangiaceae bacterium]